MGVVSKAFYLDVRAGLGVHMPDADWLVLCRAWQTAEGGNATHNPWNCTLKLKGSTDYNSVPVQNYVSRAQGVEATVKTLLQSDHASILTAMLDNADPYYVAAQIGQSDWGTDLDLFVRVMADNYEYGAKR